jgi:hypothetical protein
MPSYEASVRLRFSHSGDLDEADEAIRHVEAFIASRLSGPYWGEVTVEVDTVRMSEEAS